MFALGKSEPRQGRQESIEYHARLRRSGALPLLLLSSQKKTIRANETLTTKEFSNELY